MAGDLCGQAERALELLSQMHLQCGGVNINLAVTDWKLVLTSSSLRAGPPERAVGQASV